MPIPLSKALAWASAPETLSLVTQLSEAPADDRRLEENRLLKSAHKLLGLPKGAVPIGPDRDKALIWCVDLVNYHLSEAIKAQEQTDHEHKTETETEKQTKTVRP